MQTAIIMGVIVVAFAIAAIAVMLVLFFRNLNDLIKQTDTTIAHLQMNVDQIIARVDVSLEDLNSISKDLTFKMDKLDSTFEAVDSIGQGVTSLSNHVQDKVSVPPRWADQVLEILTAGFSVYKGFNDIKSKYTSEGRGRQHAKV
ncbi:DUF948 domain-containing protein [Aneurinibacillus sp. Ricciae_BoGa-3]|uniref:DUF948 domain-containing protein n=1 Tax=Aneurinibacillus sp. Ricciae_BoGa-3 TaxID=3022697 RepID=UPI002340A6EA|nr:DUF948 domain-containing protein [Aneurinibacillus sp. Ricciae_BoGa-3]WCK53688.1 DUF948 domain-containing protein [Aneurinibacillus sp. Ricciae_BoGa-3]